MEKKYFPITQGLACQSKWAWSTVFLAEGMTRSCHRASESSLTVENFSNFHNTDIKLADRQKMLDGIWPEGGCNYCQRNEEAGGFSDRMLHNKIPDLSPPELEIDGNAILVSPTILEVYFDNTCNLSCLYCVPEYSSKIADENRKFGEFNNSGVVLPIFKDNPAKKLAPEFWKWMDANFHTLKRFHFLGGEPFFQKEIDLLVDFIDSHPNPDCDLNFVSNLSISNSRLRTYIEKFKKLIKAKKMKTLTITASIDCWGIEQEFVRQGLDLNVWEENFKYLLDNRWIILNINQTISLLAVKTVPDLLIRLNEWKKVRPVGHFFTAIIIPSYMQINNLGPNVFTEDFKKILSLMASDKEQDKSALSYMASIAEEIETKPRNPIELKKLIVFLDEKDRRHGTNWRNVFPWLERELKDVV
jgi:organic radical activating enzyme